MWRNADLNVLPRYFHDSQRDKRISVDMILIYNVAIQENWKLVRSE